MYKQLTRFFTNPFDCGLINHDLLDSRIIEGNHEPLISREVLLKVNNIHRHMGGYGIPHTRRMIIFR